MVKECVEKEIMVDDEHPDVEKGIADFVTLEKHEVDANESTQYVKNKLMFSFILLPPN